MSELDLRTERPEFQPFKCKVCGGPVYKINGHPVEEVHLYSEVNGELISWKRLHEDGIDTPMSCPLVFIHTRCQ